MFDIRVHGADELARVARAVKETGDKGLQKELYRSLNSAVKPLTADVKKNIPEYVPAEYAPALQKTMRVRARRRTGGRNPALYLVGTAKGRRGDRFVGALDRGVLRHPLFGNRAHWFTTRIRAGFWTERLEAGADTVRRELVDALARVARQITH